MTVLCVGITEMLRADFLLPLHRRVLSGTPTSTFIFSNRSTFIDGKNTGLGPVLQSVKKYRLAPLSYSRESSLNGQWQPKYSFSSAPIAAGRLRRIQSVGKPQSRS